MPRAKQALDEASQTPASGSSNGSKAMRHAEQRQGPRGSATPARAAGQVGSRRPAAKATGGGDHDAQARLAAAKATTGASSAKRGQVTESLAGKARPKEPRGAAGDAGRPSAHSASSKAAATAAHRQASKAADKPAKAAPVPQAGVAKPDLGEVAAAKTEGQDGHGSEPAARAGAQAVDAHGAAGGGHAEAGRAHRRRDVKKDAAGGDQPAPPGPAERELFLLRQRELLVAERNNYTRQAEELRAQADALALEHEPGDVQFDEEGGEGGTANVDREIDLQLSAQARAAIEDIDAALAKIEAGTYGLCESCGTQIPEARLEALPQAKLCVRCKSGGLAARRH